MNFITLGLDQLVNHAAKLRFMSGGLTGVPLTIRTAIGGRRRHRRPAFGHVGGLKARPRAGAQGRGALLPAEAKGLLLSCIEDDDPCVCVEHTQLYWTKGAPRSRGCAFPGQGPCGQTGQRRLRDHLWPTSGPGPGAGREAGRRRDQRGSHRPPHHLSVGRGDRPGIGGVHRTCRHRPRGGRPVRRGRPESPRGSARNCLASCTPLWFGSPR